MTLSAKTRARITEMLLANVRERHDALTNAKVSQASVNSSWECMAELRGYMPPADSPQAGKPVAYDEEQHKRTTVNSERAVAAAQKELDEAYSELFEVLRAQ